ncbi:MAG: hypothetical protein ACE5EA_05080 [Nitrospirota bacterium]
MAFKGREMILPVGHFNHYYNSFLFQKETYYNGIYDFNMGYNDDFLTGLLFIDKGESLSEKRLINYNSGQLCNSNGLYIKLPPKSDC